MDWHLASLVVFSITTAFTTHPSPVTTGVHADVAFTCKARGLGPIDLTWVKNGSSLPAERHKVLVDQKQHDITSTLTIQNVIGYDIGYYYCVATNYAENITSESAFLNVTVPCPEVVTAPENITVKPRENSSFDCVAWSHGSLYYYWYIEYTNGTISYYDPYQRCDTECDSYPIIHKQEFSLTSYTTEVHTFKVFNADEQSNEGWYCCVAVNECGNTTRCGWLEVDTTPKICKHPSNITVRADSYRERTLTVVAAGKGPINYQWEKYSSSDNSWIIHDYALIKGETSPKLKFKPARHVHEGIYRCTVSNDDGRVTSNNATVTVYGPPTITFITTNTTVFEGDKVQLVCGAVNDEDALYALQIIWYKRSAGITIPLSEMPRCYNDTCNNGTLTKQLLLDPVSHYDAGEYICRAFNHHQSYTESTTFLTVEYGPVLTVHPSQSPYIVKIGRSLFLLCSASGLPKPTVQWYRNGSQIGDPLLLQQFYIVPTLKQENSNYTCVGRNNAGGKINTASASILINIVPCCPHLKDPANGKVFFSNFGDNAIFTCNDGYTIRGTSLLNCDLTTGRWSTDPPTCTK
ncbi:roundabout homolog 2-like isoform X2 [Dysidea avara]|uniref:roundabout homolog 2-like isoform X2 n=1 Tax=Dysidea avara TaxID=196820 RepID=UPI00331FC597